MAFQVARVTDNDIRNTGTDYQSMKALIASHAIAQGLGQVFIQGKCTLQAGEQLLMRGTEDEMRQALVPYKDAEVVGPGKVVGPGNQPISAFMCCKGNVTVDNRYLVVIRLAWGSQDSCARGHLHSKSRQDPDGTNGTFRIIIILKALQGFLPSCE